MILQDLIEKKIKEMCSDIDGISFKDITDKTTWVVHFSKDKNGDDIATSQKKSDVYSLISNFDLSSLNQKVGYINTYKERKSEIPDIVEDVINNIDGLKNKLSVKYKTLLSEKESLKTLIN